MKKTLYSLDGAIKKDINFKKIDLLNSQNVEQVLEEITDGNIIYAKKDVGIYCQIVTLGEKIDNRPRYNLYGRVWVFDKNIYVATEKDTNTDTRKLFYTDGQIELVRGERFVDNYVIANKKWDLYKLVCAKQKFMTIDKNIYFKTNYGDLLFAPIGTKICIDRAEERDFFIVPNSFFKVAYTVIDVDAKNEN